MITLHLGVIDMPYAYTREAERKTKKHKGTKKKKIVSNQTTGDVAEILEAKYHLMETFFDVYEEKIVEQLTESLAGAIQSLANGVTAHGPVDPFAAGAQQITEMFKQFILSGEAERSSISGVPTRAALKGVSHRKAHPYAKHDRRVSFYDTGLYVDNFYSWAD